jgi:O-antigen/teichoic acid export membrane protein
VLLVAKDAAAKVIRGILSLGSSTLLTMAVGILSLGVAARAIPQEEFGVYSLLLAVVYLLEVAGDAGLGLSAAKFVAGASDDAERQSVIASLLVSRAALVVIVTGLSFLLKPLVLALYPSPALASLFIYAPVLFAIQRTEATLSSIMQGFQLYRRIALVQAVNSLTNFALVMAFVAGLKLGVRGMVAATALSLSVAIVLELFSIPTTRRARLDWQLIKKILKFSLPLQVNDIFNFVIQRLDVLIMARLVDPAQIAYLEMARKIPTYFRRLYLAAQSVYFPHMAELFGHGRQEEAEETLNTFLRIASFLAFAAALVFFLFSREVVVLLFSAKYLPSAPALGWLMVVFALSASNQILDSGYVSAGRSAYVLVVNLVTAGVSAACNLALIPLWGFMGAVYARLAAEVSSNPVSLWSVRRAGVRARAPAYLTPAVLMLLCAGIAKLLGWDTLLLKGLLVLLYLALCAAAKAITPSDLRTLFGSVRLMLRKRTARA